MRKWDSAQSEKDALAGLQAGEKIALSEHFKKDDYLLPQVAVGNLCSHTKLIFSQAKHHRRKLTSFRAYQTKSTVCLPRFETEDEICLLMLESKIRLQISLLQVQKKELAALAIEN